MISIKEAIEEFAKKLPLEQQKEYKKKCSANQFLNKTDWFVLRHIEEQYLKLDTTLSTDEFLYLLKERRYRRSLIKELK